MSKRKRKSGNKVEISSKYVNLITAIANLMTSLILLFEKLEI